MKLTHSFTCSYEPWDIIYKKSVENNSTHYIHTHRPEIEKITNQTKWMLETLEGDENKYFPLQVHKLLGIKKGRV